MAEKPVHELKQLVGTTWTAVNRFPIEAGKIAEFAEDNPVYTDTSGEAAAEQGFDDVPAPPTYTMASAFFSCRQETERSPDLGLDLEHTLHGEQTFEYDVTVIDGRLTATLPSRK